MAIPESPSHLSTVVLFGKGLTPGKFRGLQRISNPNGTLTMVALDQNSSMIEMATKALKGKGQDREPTYEEIVEAKVDLARHLAPAASGVLIDAYYGAWSSVASGAIGPQTGLLVRVEMSGSPKNKVGAPLGLIEPGWSVEKIKLMGADAVKLLAQFEPTEPHSAEHQFQLIDHVYTECKKHDILLLLETVAFPFGGEKKTDASFLNRKAATVIESARQLSRFCDIYKAEFPGTMGHESDRPAPRQPPAPSTRPANVPGCCSRRASITPTISSRSRWPWAPAPRASWVAERSGRSTSFRTARKHGVSSRRPRLSNESLTSIPLSASKEPLGITRYGLTKENLATTRATEGWHARYGSPLGSTHGTTPAKGGTRGSLLITRCRPGRVRQPSKRKDAKAQGAGKPAPAIEG